MRDYFNERIYLPFVSMYSADNASKTKFPTILLKIKNFSILISKKFLYEEKKEKIKQQSNTTVFNQNQKTNEEQKC